MKIINIDNIKYNYGYTMLLNIFSSGIARVEVCGWMYIDKITKTIHSYCCRNIFRYECVNTDRTSTNILPYKNSYIQGFPKL